MKLYHNFISFEGIDFCGKSTQIKRLAEKLEARKLDFLIFREPGGTVISEKIRSILLSSDHDEMHKITEILLYEAARAQLVHEKLIPVLKEKGMTEVLVIMGGVIPEVDFEPLKEMGVHDVFPPGLPGETIADYIRERVGKARLD